MANRGVLVALVALWCAFTAAPTESGYLGGRDWHTPGLYANLTIDDPWLREPYGYLNYTALVNEMKTAGFHTTIAFIPWNYDRSEDGVVALFREQSDWFSVCVHGNNHDHYEFFEYEADSEDRWTARPLRAQEEDISQAVARMERFRELTGIQYDRVMVFPHAIAPAGSLGLLKRYGFLSTVNAGNVPLGYELSDTQTSKPYFEPRLFENFVSLNRWSASRVRREDIVGAISTGRPLLFFAHHDFFESGIDAFNSIAQMVNTLEPRVEWRSLGYIARHLYLMRRRSDGNYDIRAFSKELELENTEDRSVVYHVVKEENFIPPIRGVSVDGEPIAYHQGDGFIGFSIEVQGGTAGLVAIDYSNSIDVSSVEVSRAGLRVATLRRLSDFRDLYLVKVPGGRMIAAMYYGTGVYRLGLLNIGLLVVVAVAGAGVLLLGLVRRRRVHAAKLNRG